MGRNETVLPEHSLSMRRLDVGGNKDKCVKNDQTEEKVGPLSYVSIVVEGQDEHDTICRKGCAKCSKKGSTDDYTQNRVVSVTALLRQQTSPLMGPLAWLFTADLGSNTSIGKGIL